MQNSGPPFPHPDAYWGFRSDPHDLVRGSILPGNLYPNPRTMNSSYDRYNSSPYIGEIPPRPSFHTNRPGPYISPRRRSSHQDRFATNLDLDPGMLWSRGLLSPCLQHDHHLIMRYSDPPFSAGSGEIDHRHMIQVEFDQFGVASTCRSTWGRDRPWRPDRYRLSTEAATSKLQTEITMLMDRLGISPSPSPSSGPGGGMRHWGQRSDGTWPTWM